MRILLQTFILLATFLVFSANADTGCQLSDAEKVSLQDYIEITEKNYHITCYVSGEKISEETKDYRYKHKQDKIVSVFEIGDSVLRYSIGYNGRIYIDEKHRNPVKPINLQVLYSGSENAHKVLESELSPMTGFFIRSRLNVGFAIRAKNEYQRIETIWIVVEDTSNTPVFNIQKITDKNLHIRYQ